MGPVDVPGGVGTGGVTGGVGTGGVEDAEQLEQAYPGRQPPGGRHSHAWRQGGLDGDLQPPGPVAAAAPQGKQHLRRPTVGRGGWQRDKPLAPDGPAVDRLDHVANPHAGPRHSTPRGHIHDDPFREQRQQPEAAPAPGRQAEVALRQRSARRGR